MRKWYKYIVNYENNVRFVQRDEAFSDHKKSMFYDSNIGYNSKEEFFKVYFYNGNHRCKIYNNYLRRYLKKEENILSVGSGRSINELLLIEDGFDIVCSDLELPCKEEVLRLFPNLRFVKYDVTTFPFKTKFDSVISLEMFYLFDKNTLSRVFKNVAECLKAGGRFILCPGGAEDNLFSYINDEIICNCEANLLHIVQRLRRRECVVTKKHQGYRTKDEEIVSAAEGVGFNLCNLEKTDYLTEFGMRSILLGKVPKRIIGIIGRVIPCVRMFTFMKNQ